MRTKKRSLILFSSVIAFVAFCFIIIPRNNNKEAEALFIKQNLLPEELSTIANTLLGDPVISDAITNRKKDVLRNAGFKIYKTFWGNVVAEHPSMPGWLIKGPKPKIVHSMGFLKNIVRIKGAYTMKAAIKKHNYQDMIIIPKEYFFHYVGHNKDLDDTNYCIVSEKIDIVEKDLADLAPETADALVNLVKETNFFDPKGDNFCVTAQGKVALIDTEQFSTTPWINNLVGFILATTYRLCNIHVENMVQKKNTGHNVL